jgi:hypothetical protein
MSGVRTPRFKFCRFSHPFKWLRQHYYKFNALNLKRAFDMSGGRSFYSSIVRSIASIPSPAPVIWHVAVVIAHEERYRHDSQFLHCCKDSDGFWPQTYSRRFSENTALRFFLLLQICVCLARTLYYPPHALQQSEIYHAFS